MAHESNSADGLQPGDAPTAANAPPAAGSLPRSPDDPYFIPDRVGPYRVQREIGRGGMGSVLLGVRDDDQLKQHVAIKLVKRGMDTAELLRRFQVERHVLSSLNHPNIARVFDAGATTDGRPYFVMEYIEGQSLVDYCDSQRLTITERLELFKKVCSAVHAAHQNLIVHRDLKPSNIMVNSKGEPKLLDFGIAKILNADLIGSPLATLPEQRLMTPEYASPEQVQGNPITTASDVYSLGVLLYELLTGHPPYHFKTRLQDEIVHVVCEVEPDRPSTAVTRAEEVTTSDGSTRTLTAEQLAKTREGAPGKLKRRLAGDLDNVILMAMRKSPRRRYSSAEQFAQDIENHLKGHTVIARPESWSYSLSKFIQRNKAGVAAAAVMLALLIGGVITTTWQRNAAITAREREEVQRNEAENQRDLAESRLVKVRDMAKGYITDVNDSIAKTEGATTAQFVLVKTALKVMDQLVAEFPDDPELRLLLARAYREMGDIQGGVRGTNLGEQSESLRSYRKALELLIANGGADAPQNSRLEYVQVNLNMAIAARKAKDLPGALSHCENALTAARNAVAAEPDILQPGRMLASALQTKVDILRETEEPDEKTLLAGYEESLALRQKLADKFPMDPRIGRDVLTALLRLADLHNSFKRNDQALAIANQVLEQRSVLLRQDPTNTSLRRDLAITREYIGGIQLELSRLKEAEEHLVAALDILQQLADADPANARAKSDVARVTAALDDVRGKVATSSASTTPAPKPPG